MVKINLDQPATLAYGPGLRTQGLQTRFFPNAAQAIKFAMESLDGFRRNGARLLVGEGTLHYDAMRALYESPDFPLPRGKNTVA